MCCAARTPTPTATIATTTAATAEAATAATATADAAATTDADVSIPTRVVNVVPAFPPAVQASVALVPPAHILRDLGECIHASGASVYVPSPAPQLDVP